MSPSERLDQLARGENPALILRMPSGYAVMGDSQFFPGYCLLLADPLVDQLNDMEEWTRNQFLQDMATLGDAVRRATGCKRLNYSIYGNLDPFVHDHVFPRYDWEDPSYATKPPFLVPAELREDPAKAFDPQSHQDLMERIRTELSVVLAANPESQ